MRAVREPRSLLLVHELQMRRRHWLLRCGVQILRLRLKVESRLRPRFETSFLLAHFGQAAAHLAPYLREFIEIILA